MLGVRETESRQTRGGLCVCLMTLGLFLFLSCFLPYLVTLSRPRHVLKGELGAQRHKGGS